MPCRDYDLDNSLSEDERTNLKTDIKKAKQRADDNARLLCEACQIITNNNLKDSMSKELSNWWWKHDKQDRKRTK
jgi:hypothetical protein